MPGLGADADLFFPQIEHFGSRLWVYTGLSETQLEGQPPSMTWAAERCATIIATQLKSDRPYVLGGMSFGGSLAMQVASLLERKPSAIALIACNRTSATISQGFRVSRRIGSLLPDSMIRKSLGVVSSLFARREQLGVDDRDRLRAMANRAQIRGLLWGAAAVASWRFDDAAASATGVPIHQIHGQHDWVIPFHRPHVTQELKGARHLITWTHPEGVNRFLEDVLADVRARG
ncbi:MAG: alpha/beta hydrolase [Planctomycetota bacterium]